MRNGTLFTDEMRRFILMNISSIPYLEALLLMREDKNHQWSEEELSKRLYIKKEHANDLLIQLHKAGIIEKNEINLYHYQPCSDEMQKTIDQLTDVYAKNLIEVTNLIHSNIEKKAHKFANAFIWKKDK